MGKRRVRKRSKKTKKWIQGAIQHEGAFRAWCLAHGYTRVTKECIREAKAIAKRTKDMTLLRRANLAETLLELQKKRKKINE